MVLTNYQMMQTAINLRQASSCSECFEETHWRPENVRAFSLEAMANLYEWQEIIDLRFFVPQPDYIRYRLHDSKHTSTDISDLLPDGGRKAWLLDGYEVGDDGMILKFIPRYSQTFVEAARKRHEALKRAEADGLSEDECDELEDDYTRELLEKFARTIYATGAFQAWHNIASGDGEIIVCNEDKISVLLIECGHKDQKIIFDRKGRRSPRVVTYY